MPLGSHTSANADDERGIPFPQMLISADDRQDLELCMLTDRAGIDEDQACFLGGIGQTVAHFDGHAAKLFAIGLVLLTAKGQNGSGKICSGDPLTHKLSLPKEARLGFGKVDLAHFPRKSSRMGVKTSTITESSRATVPCGAIEGI